MVYASELRLIAHGYSLSDVDWLFNKGFDEAGLVVASGAVPSPAFIHDAGIAYATLDSFNDAGDPPGTNGDKYAGYVQAVRGAGWDMVAGEQRSGDIIRVVNNYVLYVNCSADDVYADPWDHPATAAHLDYINICDRNGNLAIDSCIASMNSAWLAGSLEIGIHVDAGTEGIDSGVLRGIINQAREQGIPCNNVLWRSAEDIVAPLKSDLLEQVVGLSTHFGIRHGIGGSA
jgi:hypothetical protein